MEKVRSSHSCTELSKTIITKTTDESQTTTDESQTTRDESQTTTTNHSESFFEYTIFRKYMVSKCPYEKVVFT